MADVFAEEQGRGRGDRAAYAQLRHGQTIEDEAHIAGLITATRQVNPSSARDRLRLAVPIVAALFERLAARGESLRAHTARLLGLLDDYGPEELAPDASPTEPRSRACDTTPLRW